MSVKVKTRHEGSTRVVVAEEIEFAQAQVSRAGDRVRVRLKDKDARLLADEADELALLAL